MSESDRKRQAERILYEFGLAEKLKEIGTVHKIGSYRMDMMAWNDLDLDVENGAMSLDRLYELSAFVTKTFRPLWYEAKEETDGAGKKVWFHGFETAITGELWNVDIWFFDKETISRAERYCDRIARAAGPAQRAAILEIKRELIEKGMYSFEQCKSVDVYQAVMENGVKDINEFLEWFRALKKEGAHLF